jgi:peptidyl-tRNA hydrolase, PTH1 family
MWLIVGLGNPGSEYERTRHNCGFLVIDELAERAGRSVKTSECQALTTKAQIRNFEALLIKPQTFMNLSGVAVAALAKKYEVKPERILIISDDVALSFGSLRVRQQGSAGGQNGLKSIIKELGTQNFPRLRVGIAPEHPIRNLSDFVLGEFTKTERAKLSEVIGQAADAVTTILTIGMAEAMSKYN